MTMPPMEALARAMAQARTMDPVAPEHQPEGTRIRLTRTYATIIGETPNAWARDKMASLCGANLPWFDLFGTRRAWDEEQAEASAWMWLSTRINESAPLLLLGARVCKAFRLPPVEWLEWYRSPQHGHPMIAFPHPTRSRWIRSPENALAAGLVAANVAHNRLPRHDWKPKEEDA